MSAFDQQTDNAAKPLKDFYEAADGITKKKALEHARILHDHKGLPELRDSLLGVRMREFLGFLANGNINQALETVKEANLLPTITGRFCAEPFREFNLIDEQGEVISYRALERYVGDNGSSKALPSQESKKNKRVAVVGSGIAGLTTAGILCRHGYDVTVFEKEAQIGGVMQWGIPEFRLPEKCIKKEVQYLKSLGVRFVCNCLIGQTKSFKSLENEFHAIYLATGSGLAKHAQIPGENTPGVYYADDFLEQLNHWQKNGNNTDELPLPLGPKVIVVGSGNAACDCARVCVRLGCNVVMLIRKTEQEMGVRRRVFKKLKEEGIRIEPLVNTVEISSNGSLGVDGVIVRRYDYADTQKEDEWILEEVMGSEFKIEGNNVILAIGHQPCVGFKDQINGLKLNEDGTIWTEPDSTQTSVEKYFAGGNVVDGPGPIMQAILTAQQAAVDIDGVLSE